MLTLDEIKQLMDKLVLTNLGEVSIKEDGLEVTIKAKKSAEPIAFGEASYTCTPTADTQAAAPTLSGNVVKSPIVGTFYSAASPDKPAFVTVGKKVKKGDVLFVIESMKLMNEIQSEFDGEVTQILVDNAQGVEYGQPIMTIK